jgi:hypothetical protein
MMNDEEVENFGGLGSSLTQIEDAGTGAEEQLVPQASPATATAPASEDPAAAAAPAGEDPAAAAAPSQVAGALGSLGLRFLFVNIEGRLLRRFRRLGLRKQPSLMLILIL